MAGTQQTTAATLMYLHFFLAQTGKYWGIPGSFFTGRHRALIKAQNLLPKALAVVKPCGSNLDRLDTRVQRIVFVLTINEALENNLHFGMVKDAYIAIRKQVDKGNDIAGFLMTEYYTNVVSMMIGELYRHNGTWKFNAVGNGISKDLAGLCEWYGVAVD